MFHGGRFLRYTKQETMKFLMLACLLITGCMSVKRIIPTKVPPPPIVSQPVVVEPLTVAAEHTPVSLQQTNQVFLKLVLLVISICLLSVLPKLITYLKTKWGRYPSDQDNE